MARAKIRALRKGVCRVAQESTDSQPQKLVRWSRDLLAPDLAPSGDKPVCLMWGGFILCSSEIVSQGQTSLASRIEILLEAGYDRYGMELPDRISGPCSFVIWDGRKEQLLAVADPTGAHPLFFSEHGREIVISSRMECFATANFDRIEPASVAAHICGVTPEPGTTFFRGIRVLPPGATLTINRGSIKLRLSRQQHRHLLPARSAIEASTVLRKTLFSVVPEYAPPGERIGITLSSGLDSTSIAAALRVALPEAGMVAFVWAARTAPDADESGPAMRVARALGMEVVEIAADVHHPLSASGGLAPDSANPACNVYREVWQETFIQACAQGIGTLFTGHGGDLAFGTVFPFADLFLTFRWLKLAQEIKAYRRRVDVDLPWLIRYRILGRTARWLLPLHGPLPPPWLSPALRGLVPRFPKGDRFALPGDHDRRLLLDSQHRGTTALMTAEAARFGIDLRHPYLDSRIIDLAYSFPATLSFADGFSKAIVRQAMRGFLPDEILDRPRKIYPTALFDRALRVKRANIETLLRDMRAAELGYLEPSSLRRAVDDYLSGRRANTDFWHSLSLEAWLRRFEP